MKNKKVCKKCKMIHTIHEYCVIDKNGNYHSFDDKPAFSFIQTRSSKNPIIVNRWHNHGKLHRSKGPAVLWKCLTTGLVNRQKFVYNGEDALDINLSKEKIQNIKDSSFIRVGNELYCNIICEITSHISCQSAFLVMINSQLRKILLVHTID